MKSIASKIVDAQCTVYMRYALFEDGRVATQTRFNHDRRVPISIMIWEMEKVLEQLKAIGRKDDFKTTNFVGDAL